MTLDAKTLNAAMAKFRLGMANMRANELEAAKRQIDAGNALLAKLLAK